MKNVQREQRDGICTPVAQLPGTNILCGPLQALLFPHLHASSRTVILHLEP